MSSSTHTTILITGANRGIGKGLLTRYLSHPHTTAIACVRSPSHPTALALHDLPTGPSSRLLVVKLDSSSPTDATAAVHTLKTEHHVSQLDIVVANAGISNLTAIKPVAEQSLAEVQEHLAVNGVGSFLLFQAVYPLLKEAARPKFVVVGSPLGCIAGMEARAAYPTFAYGASKAVGHYLARKIHFENEKFISFAIDPGFVQTDMGNGGAQLFGMKEATTTINDSCDYLVATIESATREETSGKFPTIEGGFMAF
ncbi:hypothetical protein MMC13_001730 [Lambiella insularis]|nr:hypothetical protein [Lambiella insularis]